VRAQRFDLDDAELKPYFSLDAMIAAMFDCAGRLFGLRFVENTDIPLHHPDARLWEVFGKDDQRVGFFIGDNFARSTKRSGAWMSVFRSQSGHGGGTLPIVINNNNFAKASPTLLSFDDVRTLFHEFGHGLHGLLSKVRYERLAGTQVLRDFVELPSQLFENWAWSHRCCNAMRAMRNRRTHARCPARKTQALAAIRPGVGHHHVHRSSADRHGVARPAQWHTRRHRRV
jgi:peptidyl-dipeptidase Dcp